MGKERKWGLAPFFIGPIFYIILSVRFFSNAMEIIKGD